MHKKTDILNKVTMWTLAAALLCACSDDLYDLGRTADGEADGIAFSVSTVEQNQMTIGLGGATRGNATANPAAATLRQHAPMRTLGGDNPFGLKVRQMALPLMGIHKATVNAPATASATADNAGGATRAPLSEIVDARGNNFHDSLTVWGWVYDESSSQPLFSQDLLKRVRNWRSSVSWPYGKGKFMQFCAIAPAFESMNIKVKTEPAVTAGTVTLPTFSYTLPETAGEMRDLLFGTSVPANIRVAEGPTGQTDGDPKGENIGLDNKTVGLTFQHALTALRFAQGKIPATVTVRRITLKGVYTTADLSLTATDPMTGTTGAWSNVGAPTANYSIYPTFTGSGTDNVYIDNDSVFFMLPHVVSEPATLEVELTAPQQGTFNNSPAPGTQRTHILSCPLTGDIWRKGYTVTYKLTIGEVEDGYYLLAEPNRTEEHSDSPISGTFNVHSYHSYWNYAAPGDGAEDTTRPVNWKVAGYSDTEAGEYTLGNKPSWLTIGGTNSGTSGEYVGGNGSLASYDISPQTFTKSGNHADILQRNTNAGTASGWDLSAKSPNGNDKAVHEYANCYIVNRQGSYKIPLYYANADKISGTPCRDHKGELIAYSLIQSQMTAKNSYEDIVTNEKRKHIEYSWTGAADGGIGNQQTLRAVIVWQDTDGLISNVGAVSSSNEINFSVEKSVPGNAVIALQARTRTTYEKSDDSGASWYTDTSQGTSGYEYGPWETLWTWHIWMTDEVYPNSGKLDEKADNEQFLNYNATNGDHLAEITTWGTDGTDGSTFKILPVNLGWVPDEMDFGYYSHRSVWVKLQQTECAEGGTPATTVVRIEQHARQPLIKGTSTVYQWGRPTALPGLRHTDKTERAVYRNTTDFPDFTLGNIIGVGDAISRPTTLCRMESNNHSWFDTSSSVPDFWGASGTLTKSVYDPCPPGFYVPNYYLFSGFSRTGETSPYGRFLNMWDDAGRHAKGAYIYTEPQPAEATATAEQILTDNAAKRYNQTVYMPSTGLYQGSKEVGTLMSNTEGSNSIYSDANAGSFWTRGHDADSKRGQALWLYPDWGHDNTSKPAIQLPRTTYFNAAMPIRPQGDITYY